MESGEYVESVNEEIVREIPEVDVEGIESRFGLKGRALKLSPNAVLLFEYPSFQNLWKKLCAYVSSDKRRTKKLSNEEIEQLKVEALENAYRSTKANPYHAYAHFQDVNYRRETLVKLAEMKGKRFSRWKKSVWPIADFYHDYGHEGKVPPSNGDFDTNIVVAVEAAADLMMSKEFSYKQIVFVLCNIIATTSFHPEVRPETMDEAIQEMSDLGNFVEEQSYFDRRGQALQLEMDDSDPAGNFKFLNDYVPSRMENWRRVIPAEYHSLVDYYERERLDKLRVENARLRTAGLVNFASESQ